MAMVSTSDIESWEAALINQFHVHMSMRNTTIKQAVEVGAWATKVTSAWRTASLAWKRWTAAQRLPD